MLVKNQIEMNSKEISAQLNYIAPMLPVSDMDKSIEFYKKYFEFEVVQYVEGSVARIKLNNFELYFTPKPNPAISKAVTCLEYFNSAGKAAVSFVFDVDDCQSVYDQLVEKGLTFERPPAVPPFGGKRCFALDPGGYLIEIKTNPK